MPKDHSADETLTEIQQRINKFIGYLRKKRRARATIDAYGGAMQMFAPYWASAGGQFDRSLTEESERFYNDMISNGAAPKSVAVRMQGLRAFCRWAYLVEGRLREDFSKDIRLPKGGPRKPRPDEPRLVADLISKLGDANDRDRIAVNDRDRIAVKLLTRIRLDDVRCLTRGEIDLDNAQIRIADTDETFALGGATTKALRTYLKGKRKSELLFPGRPGQPISVSQFRSRVYEISRRLVGQRLSPEQIRRGWMKAV